MERNRDAFRNLPEQIIFVLDTHQELTLAVSDGNYASAGGTRLDVFKSLLKRFLATKKTMNAKHRFALAYLTDAPHFMLDFTSQESEIEMLLDGILQPSTLSACTKLDAGSIVDLVREHVPDVLSSTVTPTHVTRLILVVARTSCEMNGMSPERARLLHALEETGHFFVDILYMHDIKVAETKKGVLGTQDLYDRLNASFDVAGIGYSFEVGRATRRLADAMAMLLAHPCQRILPQEDLKPCLNPPPPQPQLNIPGSSKAGSAATSAKNSPDPTGRRTTSASGASPLPAPPPQI